MVVAAKPDRGENVRTSDNEEPVSTAGFVRSLVLFIGFVAALPILSVVSSFPGGLISAAIIAFGMQQAWKMTGQGSVVVNGPYRIGTAASVAAR